MSNNQKGQSILALLILLFVFVAGLITFIYFTKFKENTRSSDVINKTEMQSVTLEGNKASDVYKPLEETKGTPKDIDNATVNELDALMKDIDSTSSEDISDLEL